MQVHDASATEKDEALAVLESLDTATATGADVGSLTNASNDAALTTSAAPTRKQKGTQRTKVSAAAGGGGNEASEGSWSEREKVKATYVVLLHRSGRLSHVS